MRSGRGLGWSAGRVRAQNFNPRRTLVDILKARWLRFVFAESYRLLRVALSKELVAVHV